MSILCQAREYKDGAKTKSVLKELWSKGVRQTSQQLSNMQRAPLQVRTGYKVRRGRKVYSLWSVLKAPKTKTLELSRGGWTPEAGRPVWKGCNSPARELRRPEPRPWGRTEMINLSLETWDLMPVGHTLELASRN